MAKAHRFDHNPIRKVRKIVKTITLGLPDQVIMRVEQRAAERGVSLSQQVTELLEASNADDAMSSRSEAIQRMNQLFSQVSGFRAEPLISREELYERGSGVKVFNPFLESHHLCVVAGATARGGSRRVR